MNSNNGVKKNGSRRRIGIIHYTQPPAISGVEMVIRDHARLLSSNGCRVFLLGASGKKFRKEIDVRIARSFDPKNPKIIQIQEELKKGTISPNFERFRRSYARLISNWIESNRIEVVIVHNVLTRHYNLALTSAIVDVANKLHGKAKFITWVHDASFIDTFYTHVSKKLENLYPWSLIAKYQKNFIYVTVSRTRKKELKKLFGEDKKIIVVPNGIDINKLLPLPLQTRVLFKDIMARHPDYIALIPVRITNRKNIEFAIEMAKVASTKFNIKFVFLVTGALHLQNIETIHYYDFLKNKIRQEKLEDYFFFLSNYKLSNGERFDIYKINIRDLYLISDFLFLPSTAEGFGLPIIEAGFMRIPIFASQLPVFKEVGNGYINIFDLNDPMEVTIDKIVTYLQRSRSTVFHKLILANYSLEKIVKGEILTLLNSLNSQ